MGFCRYFRWFGLSGALVLTGLLSLEALVLAMLFPSIPRWLCAVGMLASSLGDIILMHYKPITSKLPFRSFEAGAAAFMAAHGFYIAAFGLSAMRRGRLLTPMLGVGGVIFASLLVILLILHRRNQSRKLSMLALCTAYLAIISLCCTAVFTFAWNRGPIGLISAVGAVAFLFSDAVIGIQEVGGLRIPHAGDLIWSFYPIGQLLLIAGLLV